MNIGQIALVFLNWRTSEMAVAIPVLLGALISVLTESFVIFLITEEMHIRKTNLSLAVVL